ncbi:CapA family protein [Nocardioides lijunqiniae]|uniref:CapA family protein n=1 Tax=Nocardioides lijunqiniae TaxID=2760832 RepID=UPI001878F3B2|nr:CapA family protein [Nocardioides lijunqiniae]
MTGRRQRTRARAASGLAVAALTLAAACGAAEEPTPAPRPPDAGPAVTSPDGSSPSAPDTSPAPVAPAPVRIAVAGDVHFEGALRARLADPATALAPATAALAEADVAVVNLETSVGTGGEPEAGKRFTFQAPPSAFAALAAAGVDVVSMANNHALDLGREPLPGTFAAVDAAAQADPPLAVVGLGRDAREAFRPAVVEVGGTVVAVLGATTAGADPTADPTSQWAATARSSGTADALDPDRLLRAARAASRTADVVVAYLHWGVQGERCPGAGQRRLAQDLVESGVDVVVGSHTHRLQGDGRLGDGYVAYGLGNFAWYTQASEATSVTGVLTLSVRPAATPAGRARVTRAAWDPARIGPDGLPAPLSGADARRFETDRAALRACAGLAG